MVTVVFAAIPVHGMSTHNQTNNVQQTQNTILDETHPGNEPVNLLSLNALIISATKKITAPDRASFDFFGQSVAIDGETIAIGANGDGAYKGAVYLYQQNEGGANNWGFLKKLTPADLASQDEFGFSLTLSGDTLVVGVPTDDDVAYISGTAYLFDRNTGGNNNWGFVKKLIASDSMEGDVFGYSVKISEDGNTVVVGARFEDNDGITTNSGAAYIFERNEGGSNQWGEVKKLTAADGADFDQFGWSVTVSGDTVAVGANGDDGKGSAYLFERNEGGSNQWGQVMKVTASDGATGDKFGHFLSLDQDTLAVGALENASDQGAVYLFERNQGGSNQWGEVKKITASDGAAGDQFGNAVMISKDTLTVGAFHKNGFIGAAYLFERDQDGLNQWGEVNKITALDGAAGDQFGTSIMLNQETLVVGAFGDDGGTGSAYVYTIILAPDLEISKAVTASTGTILPGQTITYTLSFSNIGTSIATDVVITDIIPVTLTNVSIISSGVMITELGQINYQWQVQNLAKNQGGIITLTGQMSSTLSTETTFTNTAIISNSQDLNDDNNQATVPITVVPPILEFSQFASNIDEGVGTAGITVTISPTPISTVTVNVTAEDDTALASTDYLTINKQLVFTPGIIASSFNLVITDDAIVEPSESLKLTMEQPSGASILTPTVALTITDNDTAGLHRYPANLTLTEPGETDIFTITPTSQPTAPVTITLTSNDLTECTVPNHTSLPIDSWQKGVTVAVTAVDDTETDGPQFCLITGTTSSIDSHYNALIGLSITVTVQDDDSPISTYLPLIVKGF